MAFYIRFFESESIVPAKKDICPFLQGKQAISPVELEIVNDYLMNQKMKSGVNRIFLDSSKKRYLLVIPTKATDISYFQKTNTGRTTSEQKPTADKVAISSAVDVTNKDNLSVSVRGKANAKTVKPREDIKGIITQIEVQYSGWHVFSLKYYRKADDQILPYFFKAKLKNGTLTSAYQKMRLYLEDKYGSDCIVPPLTKEVFALVNEVV